MVVMLIAGCGDDSQKDQVQEEVKEYLPVSQKMIEDELRINGNATIQKYKGKPIAITYKVSGFDQNGIYSESDVIFAIEAIVDKSNKMQQEKISKLNRGQMVTVYGIANFVKHEPLTATFLQIKVHKIDESGDETNTFDKIFNENKAKYVPVNIQMLENELHQNGAAFKAKYEEKPIVIKGQVSSINSNSLDVLEPGQRLYYTCFTNKLSNKQREQLINAKKGQNVTVYGTYRDKYYSRFYSLSVDQIIFE
jgi:hypothetical protein